MPRVDKHNSSEIRSNSTAQVSSLSLCSPPFFSFSTLQALGDLLKTTHRGYFIPPRPEKNPVEGQRASADFVEGRRAALQHYLEQLAAHPVICQSEVRTGKSMPIETSRAKRVVLLQHYLEQLATYAIICQCETGPANDLIAKSLQHGKRAVI